MDNNNRPQQPGNEKRPKGNLWITLIVTVVIVLILSSVYNALSNSQYELTTYSDFAKAREEGQLLKVIIHTDRVIYTTKEQADKLVEALVGAANSLFTTLS
jgi:flagellar basal body-associated protein FliL